MEKTTNNINQLCDDLLLLIFKNFDVEELFIVEKVCKKWYNLVPIIRRSCFCLSLLGAFQNEESTHRCENRLHSCNSKQKFIFGNFYQLMKDALPYYESVQTLHINLQNLKNYHQKILIQNVASKFDNLVHLQIQINPESTYAYRQLIKTKFTCSDRLQHLVLCNTNNYEAGNLIDLSLEIAFNQRLKNENDKFNTQYAHYKIPFKFPFLRTFHSDFQSLQLPNIEKIDPKLKLIYLKKLRLDKCVINNFDTLHQLFPNLEHISLKKMNYEQCLNFTSLFKNTIQTFKLHEVDSKDLCLILEQLNLMHKLRYLNFLCTKLQFNNEVRNSITQLKRNCPMIQKFVLNKLHVKIDALDEYWGYWRTFDIINTILKRPCDLKHIDLNTLEPCYPFIDIRYLINALRQMKTLYFVTDSLAFKKFNILFDKPTKLRSLHFDYQYSDNSRNLLLNLIRQSPELRVLKLTQIELSHSFMIDLPKYCPFLVLLDINPKNFMRKPCKYNLVNLINLQFLSQLCLSNMRIHDKELSHIVQNCKNLVKLHITSSKGINGNTIYALKCKALKNPDVYFELNVDTLGDTEYYNFYFLDNFLTSIDNSSFLKINFEPFKNLIIFTPSDSSSVFNVSEWPDKVIQFKDFSKLAPFSKMKYYYIKRTENQKSFWTEWMKDDEALVPSHNGKIFLQHYDLENFIY